MSTPAVTLKVTRESVETVGKGYTAREFKLSALDVLVDGVKVGSVEAYVFRADLTPNARTRRDGAPQRGWFGAPSGERSSHRNPSRAEAVGDVLYRSGAVKGWTESRAVAKTAKVVKLDKTAK